MTPPKGDAIVSDSPSRGDASDERRMQEAFERQADGLGLGPAGPAPATSTGRMVGIAAVGTHSLVEYEHDKPPTPHGDRDREAIAEVVEKFECLHPAEFLIEWRHIATNPYVGIGEELMGTIEEEGARSFFDSEDFQETLELYPPFEPRKMTISEMVIVFIGLTRACATYRAEEEFQNGKYKVDNCAAILVKLDDGWKVTAVTTKDKGEAR